MSRKITDDKPQSSDTARLPGLSACGRAARTRIGAPTRSVRVLIMSGVFALTAGLSAVGQQDKAAQGLRVKVVDLSAHIQQITVPIRGSVTVETTVEIVRADVISKQVADVQVLSPTRLLITGQNYGTTNLVLLDADNKQSVLEVTVELDLRRLNEAIRAIDPQSSATAKPLFNHIVLTGTVSGAEKATRIVQLAKLFLPSKSGGRRPATVQNHLEVAGEQQVLLRCVVAEVSRMASRELGINGFLVGKNASDVFLINQIAGLNPISFGVPGGFPAYLGGSPIDLPFVTPPLGVPVAGANTISLGFPKVQMQLFMRAMADNGLFRILAEPNLVAISGETATFLAGGEFPYPVSQGAINPPAVQFKKFGILLNFTPVVRGHQRIRLRVAPVVSELDFSNALLIGGFRVPGLLSRATETTVELGNGETIAIAGLLKEEIRGVATRVPGIGDVPILGALFRSVSFQRSLTELVILVTPEIIAPLDAHQKVALPGEELTDPTDNELYLLGLIQGPRGDSANLAYATGAGPMSASEPDELSVHGPWGHAGSNE